MIDEFGGRSKDGRALLTGLRVKPVLRSGGFFQDLCIRRDGLPLPVLPPTPRLQRMNDFGRLAPHQSCALGRRGVPSYSRTHKLFLRQLLQQDVDIFPENLIGILRDELGRLRDLFLLVLDRLFP